MPTESVQKQKGKSGGQFHIRVWKVVFGLRLEVLPVQIYRGKRGANFGPILGRLLIVLDGGMQGLYNQ